MRGALAALVMPALFLAAAPAAAQIIPGTRAPKTTAEAIGDAQDIMCVLAAAGRPMSGLNIGMVGGEGYKPLRKLPASLAPFVESVPTQRIVKLDSPGDPVWVVHDPVAGRCAIYSFTDAAAVESTLLASMAMPGAWERRDAGGSVDHAYEWNIDEGIRLLTEISLPKAAGEPVIVVVRLAK